MEANLCYFRCRFRCRLKHSEHLELGIWIWLRPNIWAWNLELGTRNLELGALQWNRIAFALMRTCVILGSVFVAAWNSLKWERICMKANLWYFRCHFCMRLYASVRVCTNLYASVDNHPISSHNLCKDCLNYGIARFVNHPISSHNLCKHGLNYGIAR